MSHEAFVLEDVTPEKQLATGTNFTQKYLFAIEMPNNQEHLAVEKKVSSRSI